MEHLEKIIELADAELASIVKNGKFRSREEIDSVGKLIDMVKDAHCIWEYEDSENEYSEDGGMSYDRGRSYRYDDGRSYARGRTGNVRRDSRGRYSRNSYRGYSRDGKDSYIEQLREMMDDAPDEQTRQEIQRMISKMDSM